MTTLLPLSAGASLFTAKDRIELRGISIESKIKLIDWSKTNVILEKTDKVSSQLAATKKKAKQEEMVFFSYESSKKKLMAKQPVVSLPELKKLGFDPSKKPAPPVIDYSKIIQSAYSKKSKGQFKIQLTSIGIKGKQVVTISDFDLVPYYDLNSVVSDNGTGSISIPVTSHGSDYSTFRASVASRGLVRTNFEVSAQKDLLFNIPVFQTDAFSQILDSQNVSEEYGSHLLIDLGSDVDSTTIEGKFKKKIYLNERYKVVDEGSRYRFELYLDVLPGNHMIKYMDFKGRVAQKILHISQGEVTYDEPHLIKSKYVAVDLFEENIVAKTLAKIDIDQKFVSFFNRSQTSKKLALNRYKVKLPIREASFRNYLAIGDEEVVYLGFRKSKKAVIPSSEYVNYIKRLFNIMEGANSCVIQINLDKNLKDFRANVSSAQETGSYDIYFMDKDGTFSREMTGISERAFVVSHDFGVINARIDFTNGETKYLQSFCTENLYLVEQI